MTRWKKDAKEFIVSLNDDGSQSVICRLPKPIFEKLGKPKNLKFMIKGKSIVVTGENKKSKQRKVLK